MNKAYRAYDPIDFETINKQAQNLASLIEERYEGLVNILLKYESHEVAEDEIARTLDLLKNLYENKDFFKLRVGAVTSFLPRNQPLYALSCFVIIPSLMAESVHFRIPSSMRGFLEEVISFLNIQSLFKNIFISNKQRVEFLQERSALYTNPKIKETLPITDVVIFTGTSTHADQLRTVFDQRTLFIANGSGHNPIVISEDAEIEKSIEAVLTLQFYNQGQDCAAPNSILVHKKVSPKFIEILRKRVSQLKMGNYSDRSAKIGPLSDPKDLKRIQEFIVENRDWLDNSTPGIIRSKEVIVEPTIICKPLINGGNFLEIFAPIIFIQEYEKDADLKKYFENEYYAQNAMYVTLYGNSRYIQNIIGKKIKGRIIHPIDSLIKNIHLHEKGVERGTQPYGGYGYGASSISIDDKIIPMPTLPQRDIYDYVAKPIIDKNLISEYQKLRVILKDIKEKNVEKIMKLISLKTSKDGHTSNAHDDSNVYVDLHSVNTSILRYQKIKKTDIYYLLKKKNVKYIESLEENDLNLIKKLKKLVDNKLQTTLDTFCINIYEIPKIKKSTEEENKERQLLFFQHVYQLLFGKDSGPHLGQFLWNVEKVYLDKLLDV